MDERARVGFCFDLDGTLISTPILPMIAAAVDLVEEVEVLVQATEAGALPFARSLRTCCKILDEVPVTEARRRASVATADPEVAAVIASKAGRTHAFTPLPDCWLEDLSLPRGCELMSSRARVDGDRLLEVPQVLDPAAAVGELRKRYDTIVAIGAGVSDLPMLEASDVRIAFGVRPPGPVRDIADYWVTTGKALWQLLRPL